MTQQAKNLPAMQVTREGSSITGSGRSPGGGNVNPLQVSCLENPMDRGAWWATVCGVIKELDTSEWLSMQFARTHTFIHMHIHTCLLPAATHSSVTSHASPCIVKCTRSTASTIQFCTVLVCLTTCSLYPAWCRFHSHHFTELSLWRSRVTWQSFMACPKHVAPLLISSYSKFLPPHGSSDNILCWFPFCHSNCAALSHAQISFSQYFCSPGFF